LEVFLELGEIRGFNYFLKVVRFFKTYKSGKLHFHLGHSMKSQIIRQVRQIVLQGLKRYPVEVYLFGSQATGQAGTISDIDVAVNPIKPLPLGLLSRIRQELEESNVPYHVDLVDLSRLGGEWLERVRAEGVRWND
jgi:predicted nucleotidyltransferase